MSDALAWAIALKDVPAHVWEDGKAFLTKLLGEAVDATADVIVSKFRVWQWRNRIRIVHEAKTIIENEAVVATKIAPTFLLPFIEAAGNVEDETLQALWARLLASAAGGTSGQHPAFITILQQLTPDEARIFAMLRRRAWITFYWVYDQFNPDDLRGYFTTAAEDAGCQFPELVAVYLDNLERLGLLSQNLALPKEEGERLATHPGMPKFLASVGLDPHCPPAGYVDGFAMSDFGKALARACLPPESAPDIGSPRS